MKKTKKQLLGLAGLAAVGVMTAVAYGMPTPDAAAAQENTTVNVQVNEGTPSNVFVAPRDGIETTDNIIKVSTNYSQARRLEFYLTYKDASGNTHRVELPSYTPTNGAGTYTFDLDISPYGFGNFEIHTNVVGSDNVSRETDTVSFTFSAIMVKLGPVNAENANPSLEIESNSSAERIVVTVFGKDGNPAFVDENGNAVNIELSRSDIDPETGKILVELPFAKYGSKAGTYTAVVSGYDKDNKLLSMRTIDVNYSPIGVAPETPEAPETPNTGMLSLGDLNISRMDYVITGLIAFAVAAAFAVALVYRKSRR